jgi:diamine N-acetyltransferase
MIRIEESGNIAVLTDLNRDVQELHSVAYPDLFKAYDRASVEEFFSSMLSKNNWFHFVAYDNLEPVGFIQMEKRVFTNHPFRKDCTILYIHQISVRRNHEGSGVGRALIDKVRSFARESHIHRIELDVWALNDRANGFFKKMGFSTFKRQMAMNS